MQKGYVRFPPEVLGWCRVFLFFIRTIAVSKADDGSLKIVNHTCCTVRQRT